MGRMTSNGSCLVGKLSALMDLSDSERAYLASLETNPISFTRDEVLFSEGDHNQDLYIVQAGWLFNYIGTADGSRQIINVYHPGDVIGFPDIALDERTTSLFSVDAGRFCRLPKSSMGDIFHKFPRIAAMLLSVALREETVLIDRLRIFSRMSAQARLAYLYLELKCRLEASNPGESDPVSLYMPLNQQEIGDAVGLTNVSVSRAVRALEERELIETRSKEVRLLDRDALSRLCDFKNRYVSIQTDWFPIPTR